jgi:hypothetical protein
MGVEMRHARGSWWLPLAIGVSGLMLFGGLMEVTGSLGAASIPIWGITMVAAMVILRGPVGQAIGARITGQAAEEAPPLDVPAEVYAELDELRARVLELEERQDFAERLLADRTQVERDGT